MEIFKSPRAVSFKNIVICPFIANIIILTKDTQLSVLSVVLSTIFTLKFAAIYFQGYCHELLLAMCKAYCLCFRVTVTVIHCFKGNLLSLRITWYFDGIRHSLVQLHFRKKTSSIQINFQNNHFTLSLFSEHLVVC